MTLQPGGKWGFIDQTGKMVIPPQFEAVHWFSEGLCAVRQDKKWGFIDPTGKLVIQAQYEQVGSFSEGLAHVVDGRGKFGFIDRTGKLVIPCAFTYAGDFAEERAWVVLNGKAGIIDPTGKVAFTGSKPPDNDWSKFTGGLARAYSQGKWGYVDKAGQFTIEPRFDYAWDFSGPTAVVQLGERTGVIDRTGKLVVEMQHPARLERTFDGLTSFTRNGEYWGFVDSSGKTVIQPRFFFSQPPLGDVAPQFSEGRATVYVKGKYGFIDRRGKLVIAATFDGAGRFSEGLAPIATGHRVVLIDKTGKVVKEFAPDKVWGGKRESSE